MELEATTGEATAASTSLEELSEGMSAAGEATVREATRTTLAGHRIVGVVAVVKALTELCSEC